MKTPISRVRLIALTTGDAYGVGFEVSAKALSSLSSQIKKEKVKLPIKKKSKIGKK